MLKVIFPARFCALNLVKPANSANVLCAFERHFSDGRDDNNDGYGSKVGLGDKNLSDQLANYQGSDHEFSPYHEREQSSDCIHYHGQVAADTGRDQPMRLNTGQQFADAEQNRRDSVLLDSHVDNYDKQGSISLHSVMQSNVPEPFQPGNEKQSPGAVNMPGGSQHSQMSLRYTSDRRHGNNDPAGEIV